MSYKLLIVRKLLILRSTLLISDRLFMRAEGADNEARLDRLLLYIAAHPTSRTIGASCCWLKLIGLG